MKSCPSCKKLEKEVKQLKERLQMLESKPMFQAGFSGESIVSKIVDGIPTAFCVPHDITTIKNGKLLEVKYSNLNVPVKGRSTKRWTWAHIFGSSGKKVYDQLILVGDRDLDIEYGDLVDCPYVFFDVPYHEVEGVMRASGLIQISTNPKKARTKEARLLFDKYILSSQDLNARYGLLEKRV